MDATTLTLQTLQGSDAEALYGNLGALQIIPTQYILEGDAAQMAAAGAGGLNIVTINGQQVLVPAMYFNHQLGGGEQLQYLTTAGDGTGGDVLPPIMPLFVSPFTNEHQQVGPSAAAACLHACMQHSTAKLLPITSIWKSAGWPEP